MKYRRCSSSPLTWIPRSVMAGVSEAPICSARAFTTSWEGRECESAQRRTCSTGQMSQSSLIQ